MIKPRERDPRPAQQTEEFASELSKSALNNDSDNICEARAQGVVQGDDFCAGGFVWDGCAVSLQI